MGKIREWGRDTRATIGSHFEMPKYYMELQATDDEKAVRAFWDNRICCPKFIVAPDKGDSRTNSVVAANIRRIIGDSYPICVMVRGRIRRERMDMTHWLIENDYVPMFPRFMFNEASPSVPLNRQQLIHEVRPILDRELEWMFAAYEMSEKEGAVWDYMRSTGNQWEVFR